MDTLGINGIISQVMILKSLYMVNMMDEKEKGEFSIYVVIPQPG